MNRRPRGIGSSEGPMVSEFAIPARTPLPSRFRVWLKVPTEGEVTIIDVGAGGSFSLPGNLDADLAPFSLLTVDSTFPPRGSWELNGRLSNPATVATLGEDINPFGVQ